MYVSIRDSTTCLPKTTELRTKRLSNRLVPIFSNVAEQQIPVEKTETFHLQLQYDACIYMHIYVYNGMSMEYINCI